MWFFKSKKKEKRTAFRERVIVSGMEMPSRTIAAEKEQTKTHIEHIQKNIDKYRADVMIKYNLGDLPNCQLKKLEEPIYIESADVYIVAEFIYTYEEVNNVAHGYKMAGKIFIGLGLMSIVGLVGTVLVFMGMEYKYEQSRKNIPRCAIQYLEDKPHSIVVGTSEYKLREDGTMSREERMFLNPWHQEIINNNKCVRIDLTKK